MTGNIHDRLLRRVLTTWTVRIGQRVEVYAHPHVQPIPHQGATGTVQQLPTEPSALAGIRIDQYPNYREANGNTLTWIPLQHLTPLE